MKKRVLLSLHSLLFIFCYFSIANAAPPNIADLEIQDISAPHPKHCLDERQWKDTHSYNPFNIFDTDPSKVWQPCSYALKDAGYTVNIVLKKTIEIDGFELGQANANEYSLLMEGKKKKRKKRGEEPKLQTIKKMQILFFNFAISKKYPVYFQEVKFDGKDKVPVKYAGTLNWNPILLGEPMFDERRRALKLPPSGMTPPIKVDQIGFVFPDFNTDLPPPVLKELQFFNNGKVIKVKNLAASRKDYGDVMSKVYDLMVRDFMFIGEERAMIFSQTGTLWAMEGEEEIPKVIGGWRYHAGRIEVDLSAQQKQRIKPKMRKHIEKVRNKSYRPLHLLVDEAPDRIHIYNGKLAGEYQTVKVPTPTEILTEDRIEPAPSFEVP